MFPAHIQYFMSTYLVFGIFPLDKVLHLLVGMFITIVMRLFKFRMRMIFLIIAVVALIKEAIDSRIMTNTIEENILDAIATFSYPLLLHLAIKVKSAQRKKMIN